MKELEIKKESRILDKESAFFFILKGTIEIRNKEISSFSVLFYGFAY